MIGMIYRFWLPCPLFSFICTGTCKAKPKN
jgi:hypothetical protein